MNKADATAFDNLEELAEMVEGLPTWEKKSPES